MKATPDLLFQETMSGPLGLGARSPEVGKRWGRTSPLSLHATIRIDSMEDFLQDPAHTAWLGGQISFTPFAQHLPILRGSFHLFSNSNEPSMRLMRYGALFEHEGRAYWLSGTKYLRDDPGPDLWPDTTRLLTTLHEGQDERAPVVGAGVLSIGVRGLLALAASMRSPRGGPRELARFGRFFLGNLWDLYVHPPALSLAGLLNPRGAGV